MPHGYSEKAARMKNVLSRKVIVADGDGLARLGLRTMLTLMPGVELTAEAVDGASVMHVLEGAPPDVLLMDVNLPNPAGMTVLPRIRAKHPALRIVMMTSKDAERLEAHVLHAGADAIVSKSASRMEFAEAIAGSARRTVATDVPRSGFGANASPRELEVGRRIAVGHTNEEIAEELNLSVNTVKTYVSRLFIKHGVSNRVQLANVLNGVPIEPVHGVTHSARVSRMPRSAGGAA